MTATTPGRETIQIVEIVQPLCALTYGTSPCTASGTADEKCYNTFGTCQDQANYDGSSALSLYFSRGHVAEQRIEATPGGTRLYIIPSLANVSTAPTRINIAGANPDAQGIGNRAICSVTFKDHPHTDRRVDPYLSGRSWDPMTRGSFWTKWKARNKYHTNIRINVYEGYAGQALSQMVKRSYFVEGVQGPSAQGDVTISGKDILARIEARQAQAPIASPGKLSADITAGATSFNVANCSIADYDASGTLRIGDELMTYTTRAAATGSVDFSGVTRGTDGSTASAHSADDSVQLCLRYTDARIDDTIKDLLENYGGVQAAFLNTTAWATEINDYRTSYLLNTVISEPTPVTQLISELQESVMVYIWWDERTALVELKAVRGIDAEPPLITDDLNILAESFSLTERPRSRASQVWVFYDHRDFVSSFSDPINFRQQSIFADLPSEGTDQYGSPSIRKIFSRWLNAGALADTIASQVITRFVDIPTEARMKLDAKDRTYWVGDTLRISHFLDVDSFGVRQIRNWTIVSAEETVPGQIVDYVLEDTTLYGRIHYIMASGAADYPGAASAPFKNCYIGDANGLLSDGTPCGRIT